MSALATLILIFNLFASWFNAWSVGKGWAEARAAGGLTRFMAWCGAIMSASGFTWCYTIILCLIWQAIPGKYHLPDRYANGMLSLGYLFVIIPILGSGLAITIQSWAHFYRERNFKNGAVAGWNSFADIYNTYQAISAIPEAISGVSKMFGGSSSSDDDEEEGSGILGIIVVAVVVAAVIGGIMTTTLIIRATARSTAEAQSARIPSRNRYGFVTSED